MSKTLVKTTFFRGLALAIPMAVVIYVFIRITSILEKMITPAATKLGIHRLLGSATLTILAVLLIVIIILILGLLMRISFVFSLRKEMENTILKFVPSLNYLKVIADDKLQIENTQDAWKPVLIYFEEKYSAAFVVEESESLITLFVAKGISMKEGEILMTKKKDINLFPATYEQLHKYSRSFGKGFISLVK